MGERLGKIYAGTDWKGDPNKPGERAAYYAALLAGGSVKLSAGDEAVVRQQMGMELLRAGDARGAVTALGALREMVEAKKVVLVPEAQHALGEWLALAYLRLGEQENCVGENAVGMGGMRHAGAAASAGSAGGRKMCVFPIRAAAAHRLTEGATGAVRELTGLLRVNAEDYESRWLLNVAYMQLGRYPAGVPKQWLIAESLFKSETAMPEFADVAAGAGVDVQGHAGGVVMEDFDGDGLLDLMVTSSAPLEQMRFFHNNGDGTFEDRTAAAGLTGETGGLNLVVTDYNNDGFKDVLVLRGGWWGEFGEYPMSLLRNNGDGTFEDVTVAAGLLSAGPTQTAAWADFDGDGRLDLFVGHEAGARDGKGGKRYASQLFHNNGDGTFTDIAAASGLADLGFVKGVAWGDYNRDGRPDLYVSVMGGRNRLFRNDGAGAAGQVAGWKFTDVTEKAGVGLQRNSFATWFFDFDNDGWPDIFVAGYSTGSMNDVGAFEMGQAFVGETPRLYRNNRDGTFTDVSKTARMDRAILVMGANFGELRNDGFLDVYLGTGESQYQALLPNRMFKNDGGKRFLDVTTAGGFGHLQKGHSIAFGDLFGTGNEDIFEEMGGALPGDGYQSALYKNPGGTGNHWISVEVEGVKTNKAGFGTVIDVSAGGRHVVRTVGYGSSFGGNPLRQHIGLGAAAGVIRVEVRWPLGGTQVFDGVAADGRYRVKEGEGLVRVK